MPSIRPCRRLISIELSSRCNLACPECITGAGLLRRKNEFISYTSGGKDCAGAPGP
ncbi:MAG: hypothetical protein MZV63_44360 [Marinilabiliales bacterium]|nr:hypothetical protein [Marinilabiliales bacterium]